MGSGERGERGERVMKGFHESLKDNDSRICDNQIKKISKIKKNFKSL